MTQLEFDPLISMALWLPLAIAAVVLLIVYGIMSRGRLRDLRRAVALTLMSIALIIPLAILLNPTWIERLPPPAGKPLLTVLVDTSASMATNDVDGKSRLDAARELVQQVSGQLSQRFEIEIRTFATSSSMLAREELDKRNPDGNSTDLASTLEESLSDRPQGQAILLLSDGIHNAGGGAAQVRKSVEKARALATPIFATTMGDKTTINDLEVQLSLPEEMAFVGQEVPVAVSIRQRGALADQTKVFVQLNEELVDQREVKLKPDGVVEEVFKIRQSETGLYRYDIRAAPLTDEVANVNNRATLFLRVIDEPVRILVLEGKPYWDTKFLVRTLATDQSVELSSVVRMAEGRFLERKISRPRAEEASSDSETPPTFRNDQWQTYTDVAEFFGSGEHLQNYQVIVLGRDAEVFLTDESVSELRKWLVQGDGSLVCFRGPPSSQVSQRLGRLMPVRWSPTRESRFRVRLTESGQSMRWLPGSNSEEVLTSLPSLSSMSQAEQRTPLATVLATGTGQTGEHAEPVISYQPIGNGRVVVVEGAGMWRWAFLPTSYVEHEQIYGRLWRSLIRWLVANVGLLPSQNLTLRSDKVTFNENETASGTLLVRETALGAEPPKVELSGAGMSEPQTITPIPSGSSPGQFRVVFGELPEGQYRARAMLDEQSTTSTEFDVRGNFRERLDVAVRDDMMRMIAEQSGGAVLEGGNPNKLVERFDEHLSANLPQRVVRTTAWDRWWVLVGVFAAWAATWGVRRRAGLI